MLNNLSSTALPDNDVSRALVNWNPILVDSAVPAPILKLQSVMHHSSCWFRINWIQKASGHSIFSTNFLIESSICLKYTGSILVQTPALVSTRLR